MTPLIPSELRDVIRGIRASALLDGVRGEEGGYVERLVEIFLRLAQRANRHPRTQELDINPLLAMPVGEQCPALDVRIKVGSSPEQG